MALMIVKSPVLLRELDFTQWQLSHGIKANAINVVPEPTHYPCFAIIAISEMVDTLGVVKGSFDTLIEYVYFDDFKFGFTGVMKKE